MGGGKGGQSTPQIYPNQGSGMEPGMALMMEALLKMMASQQQNLIDNMPEVPELPTAPMVPKITPTDWTEKQKELAMRAAVDYGMDRRNRHGRSQTIHTSVLLDDEEPTTTGTLLT